MSSRKRGMPGPCRPRELAMFPAGIESTHYLNRIIVVLPGMIYFLNCDLRELTIGLSGR